LCKPEYHSDIEGDLLELYHRRVTKIGQRRAGILLFKDVILLLRPGIVGPLDQYNNVNNYGMYKSYFKIGWRNLVRSKGYSFINIGGLAVGMAAVILIGLWIFDELSYNKYFKNYDRIGHVMVHNGEGTYPSNPIPLSVELRSSYSDDFKYVVMSTWTQPYTITYGDKKFFQNGNFMQTDAAEMLALEMIHGTRSALKDPNSMLISESLARKLFNETDPMDKIIRIKNMVDVKVGGVYRDFPQNTEFYDLAFIGSWDFLVSWMTWMKEQEDRWDDNSYKIFVQLSPQANFEEVSAKIKDLKLKHVGESNAAFNPELFVHPMSKWHLYSKFNNRINITSDRLQFVWLYGIIGVFVLMLACINFMNLSTARSERRAREVGIRKTLGSFKSQLVHQFFAESLLTAVLALVLGMLMVQLALPWFNEIAGKKVSVLWMDPFFWLAVISFVIITGSLAGSYPALYLSSFKPVRVLKGVINTGPFSSMLRKILVVIQFGVSVTLITGTIIVYQQIQFAKDRPVGYTRDGLMSVYMITPDLYQHYDMIRNELLQSGAVSSVATSSGPVTDVWANNSGISWKGKHPDMQSNFVTSQVTPDYGKTIGWQIKEGRDFSAQLASDSTGVIINEAAVKYMGLLNPIEEILTWNEDKFHIIGVVNDLIMGSPFATVQPTLFLLNDQNIYTINIRINPESNTADALAKISKVFQKHNPSVPFDYKFVDEVYERKFTSENRVGKLSAVFATLAVLISCLGLFGLASFVAEQRTKEIGIRKVMGASVSNIWRMLSKDFVFLVSVSCLIAIPISDHFLNQWLLKYEYRIEIGWYVFAGASVGALIITLLTVSYQAVKAALMNPVKSLRSE
jgi:ABC-type antimicrobial peptide transport system permease subunit